MRTHTRRVVDQLGRIAWALAAASACSGDPRPASPSSPDAVRSSINGRFDAAVLIERAARDTTDADVRRIVDRADTKLQEKAGEALSVTDIVWSGDTANTVALASEYVAARPEPLPEGIVIVTHEGLAHSAGGYSSSLPVLSFWNEYPSPVLGRSQIYLAFVEVTHRYALCGYDAAGNHVSNVPLPGECHNTLGATCVPTPAGWMCANSLDDLYANPDYFVGCLVVHEFLHPFGGSGDGDHWGTPECRVRTGMTQATASDRREAQDHCGMCPDLFQAFRRR